MSIDQIIDRLRKAKDYQRPDIIAEVERDYGKGFARTVKDAYDADEQLRSNEASISRKPSRRR